MLLELLFFQGGAWEITIPRAVVPGLLIEKAEGPLADPFC